MIYNGDNPKITFKLSSIDRHFVEFDYYNRNGINSIAAYCYRNLIYSRNEKNKA